LSILLKDKNLHKSKAKNYYCLVELKRQSPTLGNQGVSLSPSLSPLEVIDDDAIIYRKNQTIFQEEVIR
jgi:hypothetical protein